MWALIVVGPALERMLGRLRFLAVYLVSALGGSVLFYILAAAEPRRRSVPPVRSSACSAPGSCWPGG